jgi:hypothetical protein
LAAAPGVIPALTSFCKAETVSVFSFGRPGFFPRFRAAAMPSRVRSEVKRRSKWAIAPNTWNTNSPAALDVSSFPILGGDYELGDPQGAVLAAFQYWS